MTASDKLAQRLAIGVPALLLGGAYLSQYGFGLVPCEMCWWQRYAHFAALGLALLSTVVPPKRLWVLFAALAVVLPDDARGSPRRVFASCHNAPRAAMTS